MGSEKRKYVRLSNEAWAEIDALWELGEATLPELADRYGVSTRTLQAHFEKNGVVKGSKGRELAREVKAEIFSRASENMKDIARLAGESKRQAYVNSLAIEGLLMEQLQIAASTPAEAYRTATAIKSLALAAQTTERLLGIKYKALGLDRNELLAEELPEIKFRYITNEEALEMRRAQEAEDDWSSEEIKNDSAT